MKRKRIFRTFAVLLAALVSLGGFSVTAYAQTPEETPPPVTVPETPTDTQPLTPEGNATLVDDFGGDKQLITVTTKSGKYFYILVDRAAEGDNTVHFLNQVDEADLMALMEDEDGKQPTPVCTCTEKCETGKVNIACDLCKTDTSGCTGKPPAPAEQEETEQPKKEKSNSAGLLLIVLLLAGVGGGAFYYFKVLKPKQTFKGNTDIEDFDFEDEDETEDTAEQETPAQDFDEQEDEE
ncbi:DUF4366 domain-containing protein [Lactococcus lactis]|nr:DUF4366 domain-containing protein [Lactococcus lactis]MDT2935508.1 DUF4366 domain-containing protein [Lactococcus lactis]